MNPHQVRDSVLAAVGCLALLAYILACTSPSFSPDDSKIAFSYRDPGTGNASIGVYDRNAGTTDPLLILEDDDLWVSSGWMWDGRSVIAAFGDPDEDHMHVALLPYRSKEPTRVLSVSGVGIFNGPPQVLGQYLYLSADSSVLRLDLVSGSVQRQAIGEEASVWVNHSRLYYGRMVPVAKKSGGDDFEVGRLDASTLECAPIFRVPYGGDRYGIFAASWDGSRIAATDKAKRSQVLVFRGNTLAATIPFGPAAEGLEPSNLLWAPDGATIYAAYMKSLPEGGRKQFGVLQLPVNGAPSRQIPLFVGDVGEAGDAGAWAFQIELSHDGKTLAGISSNVEVAQEDLALYLIDVSQAHPAVTKMTIAAPPE